MDFEVTNEANKYGDSLADGLGWTYLNDTGLDGHTFLTGEDRYTPQEVEVFALTD
jgi:hypothetical protein